MASTTDLGKWMLTNGGEYNPETAYEQLTMVMYENSTYITLKTVQGITPTDDHINYQLMAKGFNPTALESVQAEDTSGVLGEVGGTVSAQDLINWVVDQAATKLLKISDLVSVQTNDATKGVSAALAYAMGQKLDQLNSNLEQKLLYTTDLLPVQAVFGREVVSTTGKTGSIDLSKYIPAGRTHYSFCIVSSEGSHPLYSIVQDNKLVVNMIDSTASTTFVVNFMIFVH